MIYGTQIDEIAISRADEIATSYVDEILFTAFDSDAFFQRNLYLCQQKMLSKQVHDLILTLVSHGNMIHLWPLWPLSRIYEEYCGWCVYNRR